MNTDELLCGFIFFASISEIYFRKYSNKGSARRTENFFLSVSIINNASHYHVISFMRREGMITGK